MPFLASPRRSASNTLDGADVNSEHAGQGGRSGIARSDEHDLLERQSRTYVSCACTARLQPMRVSMNEILRPGGPLQIVSSIIEAVPIDVVDLTFRRRSGATEGLGDELVDLMGPLDSGDACGYLPVVAAPVQRRPQDLAHTRRRSRLRASHTSKTRNFVVAIKGRDRPPLFGIVRLHHVELRPPPGVGGPVLFSQRGPAAL